MSGLGLELEERLEVALEVALGMQFSGKIEESSQR